MDRLATLYSLHVAHLRQQYDAALARAGYDAVAVHAGSAKKRIDVDDQYWSLRPTPHFQHWVPLAEADAAMIVVAGKEPVLARVEQTSFWEKPAPPESDHFLRTFESHEVAAPKDMQKLLPAGKKLAFVGEDRARAAELGIADANVNPPELVRALDKMRTTKTPYEVYCLEIANHRAAAGHDAVLARFKAGGASELELHLAYLGATKQDDPETPYKNIVALGKNAATLHHIAYGRGKDTKDSESLLLDAGATFAGYCSDITRTWVRGTSAAASAFRGMVEGVEAMQKRLCDAVRVGMPYEELHEESHRQVARILRDVGITKLPEEAVVSRGITRAFFPHGLGHSLGLQCHDVGCAEIKPKPENPFLRNTSTIAAGQVFTIEPGIYFIDGLLAPVRQGSDAASIDWKLVDALAELGGVRIEDDVVVGNERIGRNLTREVLPLGGGAA